jgi:hypothetical protein
VQRLQVDQPQVGRDREPREHTDEKHDHERRSNVPHTLPRSREYFNLSTRRINGATTISSKTATAPGLGNVRDSALYAQDTPALPVNSTTTPRYDSITGVLADSNTNKIEVAY